MEKDAEISEKRQPAFFARQILPPENSTNVVAISRNLQFNVKKLCSPICTY